MHDRNDYYEVGRKIPSYDVSPSDQGFKLDSNTVHLVGLYKRDVADSSCNRVGGSGPAVAPVRVIDWKIQIRSEIRTDSKRGKYLLKKYKMENNEDHVKGFLAGVGNKYPELLVREDGEKENAHLKRFWEVITKGFSKTIYDAIHPK